MKALLRLLSNAQLMVLILFSNIIFTYAFLQSTSENELTTNIYFLSERFDYLVMSIVGYNIVSRSYHIIAIPACAIALMRFINEVLHTFNIVQLNNPYLLTTEFLIIIVLLWRLSKVTYV